MFFHPRMTNLYIVGTYHQDIDGPERLEKLLHKIAPRAIVLEMSKEREILLDQKQIQESNEKAFAEFKKYGVELTPQQKETMIKISTLIPAGYERNISCQYAIKNNIPLENIDLSFFETNTDFTNAYIGLMDTNAINGLRDPQTREILRHLAAEGIDTAKVFLRLTAQVLYAKIQTITEMINEASVHMEELKEIYPPEQIQFLKKIINPERDEAMAKRIREVYTGESLVAIVGFYHMAGLQKKLSDLQLRFMTLAEYNTV